jgi:Ca2+-binding RTX toxin-like protein
MLAAMVAALVLSAGVALAAAVDEGEPNDSRDGAQTIDANSFSLDFDPNIGNTVVNTSEIVPHATINGTGNDTVDYYSFTVSQAGDGVILDVDGAIFCNEEQTFCDGFDSYVYLYDSSGQSLIQNDDSDQTSGQGGSLSTLDSYLEYTFQTPGTYYVAVGRCCDVEPIPIPAVGFNGTATSYQLQVSLGELPFICQGQIPTIEAQSGRSVKGTRGDDVIAGTQGADTINGNGGNDSICGRDGNDSISGGDGDDSMSGGDGDDRIKGDRGGDSLFGEGGDDTLDGGLGPDYIDGGDGTDKCSLGENGRDQCELAIGPNVNP